jgi:tetratricopeptide (TPR) repeat protein
MLVRRLLLYGILLGILVAETAAVSAQNSASVMPDTLFAQNKFNQARAAYAAAIKRTPNQVALRLGMIRALLRLDAWSEAITQGRAAVAAAPQNADAHGLLAMALMRGGQPDAAAAEAKRALAISPDSYWGLVATGRVLLWEDQSQEARKVLTRATTLHPDWPEAWFYRLDTYKDDAVRAEAIQCLRAYVKLAPKGYPHDRALADYADSASYTSVAFKPTTYHPAGPFPATRLQDADEGKAAPISVTFPIERSDDSIIVPITVNGEKFHMLFDTGAADSIALAGGQAESLKLPLLAKSVVRGVSGKEAEGVYKADEVTIGNLKMHSIPIDGMDTDIPPTDGLLGGAVFHEYAVTVDFEKNTMTLTRGKNAAAPPPAPGHHIMTIPFHNEQGYIFVPIKIQGQDTTEWGLLDTGASGMGVLSLIRARELGKKQAQDATAEVQVHHRLGVGTSNPSFTALLFEFGIELTLCNTEKPKFFVSMSPIFGASMIDEEINRSFDFQLSAIVGISYLTSAKRVTFDYPHRLLTMELADIGGAAE